MKRHIKLSPQVVVHDFSPINGGGKPKPYNVNLNAHFSAIKGALNTAHQDALQDRAVAEALIGLENTPQQTILTFKENTKNPARLKIDSLDKHGMELVSVNKIDGIVVANVAVPFDKFASLADLVEQYGHEKLANGKPKNQPLIESISFINNADIPSLWFSDKPFPNDVHRKHNFELWFTTHHVDSKAISLKLAEYAPLCGITLKNDSLNFKQRLVKIAAASITELEKLQRLTGLLVEVRPAAIVASDFTAMPATEQMDWSQAPQYDIAPGAIPICILDTGVNGQHPLLRLIVNPKTHIVHDPSWGVNDVQGHGTNMAGLAALGDLKLVLFNSKIDVTATIESAKILPDHGSNEPELYGVITSDVVYNIDAIKPSNNRVYTLAITADYSLRGRPSSWSAALDLLAAETPDDDSRRLFIVAAGNIEPNAVKEFPAANETSTVQDPGNAYNALTVGYWASEENIVTNGYQLLAELTDIGPTTTSSQTWERSAPLKPEVIFEGGNHGYDPMVGFTADLDELSILTTAHDFADGNFFGHFGETSAATALAANFVAKVWHQYPRYWPETIRALVVHSAEWPQKLYQRYAPYKKKQDVENLIRIAGYGYPNIEKALHSGDKAVNLVIEDQIQPYTPDGKLNNMLLYTLPWPENELSKLAEEEVKLRITLSYFIEPNPGERGWITKYNYCSFALRFDLNSAEENSDEFVFRINKKFREGNPDLAKTASDSDKWLLGQQLRSNGSIHSDVWSGTAQELAEKKYIAIYPVSGWWKELKTEKRQSSIGRFSLIVSIETAKSNLTIHNEIVNKIAIENVIETAVPIV